MGVELCQNIEKNEAYQDKGKLELKQISENGLEVLKQA